LIQKLGPSAVIRAARDLGISTPIPDEATIALGTSTVSLLELTAAYASVAAESYPVQPRGLDATPEKSWYENLTQGPHPLTGTIHDEMLDLLAASAQDGTGRQAALAVPTYGKTGTTQDSRDALFIGFANGLVCAVWVGNDDNTPNPGLSGGGIPARVWRDFMSQALGVSGAVHEVAAPDNAIDPDALLPDNGADIDTPIEGVQGDIQGLGLNLHIGRDGHIELHRQQDDSDDRQRQRDDRDRQQRDEQEPADQQ
jgi:penicillin-binding protein 1A